MIPFPEGSTNLFTQSTLPQVTFRSAEGRDERVSLVTADVIEYAISPEGVVPNFSVAFTNTETPVDPCFTKCQVRGWATLKGKIYAIPRR